MHEFCTLSRIRISASMQMAQFTSSPSLACTFCMTPTQNQQLHGNHEKSTWSIAYEGSEASSTRAQLRKAHADLVAFEELQSKKSHQKFIRNWAGPPPCSLKGVVDQRCDL